jgi:hypothetical protein
MSSKEKGDLLEDIVERICSGIENVRIKRNAKIVGRKTHTERDIDVLIEGQIGVFKVKIAVESKNYGNPVGVEKIESLKSKLEDIGADLGVIVCPAGFSEPARQRAAFDGIQLFEIFDPQLGNTDLFVPVRYVEPEIKNFRFQIRHRAQGPFSMPTDNSRWRFHIGGRMMNAQQLVLYTWNNDMIPQQAGRHVADFNALAMSDAADPQSMQYCEIAIEINVSENYYLKLFPASFLKNSVNGKQAHNLRLDIYSKEEDMLKNGWKKFKSLKAMNKAADIENQPEGVRNLVIRSNYAIAIPEGP